jgi:hypothetical protein
MINVEKEELVKILCDVMDSLEIMRDFQNGEVRPVDAKALAHKGCIKLGRAKNKLETIGANPFSK